MSTFSVTTDTTEDVREQAMMKMLESIRLSGEKIEKLRQGKNLTKLDNLSTDELIVLAELAAQAREKIDTLESRIKEYIMPEFRMNVSMGDIPWAEVFALYGDKVTVSRGVNHIYWACQAQRDVGIPARKGGFPNADAHLRAKDLYQPVPGLQYEYSDYEDDFDCINLVEYYPDKVDVIFECRNQRHTIDPDVISEYVENHHALSNGEL